MMQDRPFGILKDIRQDRTVGLLVLGCPVALGRVVGLELSGWMYLRIELLVLVLRVLASSFGRVVWGCRLSE